MTTTTATPVTLKAHRCNTGVTYRVTFTGPDADTQAVAYMDARGRTHAFQEDQDAPLDFILTPATVAALYPTCHHGMDARLCGDPEGPHHFGTYAGERARAGY